MGGIAGDFVADGNELHNCTNKGNVVGGNPESNFTGAIVGTYSDKSGLKEPCIYDCNVNSGFVSNANNEEKLAGFVFGSVLLEVTSNHVQQESDFLYQNTSMIAHDF